MPKSGRPKNVAKSIKDKLGKLRRSGGKKSGVVKPGGNRVTSRNLKKPGMAHPEMHRPMVQVPEDVRQQGISPKSQPLRLLTKGHWAQENLRTDRARWKKNYSHLTWNTGTKLPKMHKVKKQKRTKK